MIFSDRGDAGRLLADHLRTFTSQKNTVVIGIPRGGVIVAGEVAKELNLPLDIVCPRKVGAPLNPEFAIGAVTESGEAFIEPRLIQRLGIDPEYLKDTIEEESKRARQRLEIFREGMAPRELKGKSVILVDDGLATGSTVKAAIVSLRKEGVQKIIVAVPVAPVDTALEIKNLSDDLVVLHTDRNFMAVGQYYRNFLETSNADVIAIMHELCRKKIN